jgi:O-antigen/teichoic acid export membrane protein
MSNKNSNLLVKNTSMLYIRTILQIGVGLFTSRIVLKALGIEDFGVYTLVSGFVLFFSFLNNALSAASSRFLAIDVGKNDLFNLKKTFKSVFTVHLILACIVVILLETVGLWYINTYLDIPENRMYAANFVFHFSTFSTFIMIIQVPLTGLIIAREEMQTFAYVGLFDVFSKLLVAYLILTFNGDKLILYSFMLAMSIFIIFFFYNLYCRKKFREYSLKLFFDKIFIIKIVKFTSWSFIGSFSLILKDQGSNILLNIFFGPKLNAARGISFMLSNASNSLCQGFTTAIRPQIIKSYANEEREKTINLIHSGSKISFFILYITCLGLIFETKFVLNLWLVDVPQFTVIFTKLMLINMLIDSFTNVMGAAVQANGNIKYHQIVISGLLLLNIPISYVFLKFGYSPEIIFVISIIISVLALVLRLFFMKFLIPKFDIYNFIKKVFSLCVIVVTLSFIPTCIIYFSLNYGLWRFIIILLTSSCSTVGFIWVFGLNKEEKNIMLNIFNNKILKKIKK